VTLLERRIERVEMAISQAQSRLEAIKARAIEETPSVNQGAFLCEASKQMQEAAHDLQKTLLKKWVAGHEQRMALRLRKAAAL
jgi:uncharacterized protein with PhoU and TrkA domain